MVQCKLEGFWDRRFGSDPLQPKSWRAKLGRRELSCWPLRRRPEVFEALCDEAFAAGAVKKIEDVCAAAKYTVKKLENYKSKELCAQERLSLDSTLCI